MAELRWSDDEGTEAVILNGRLSLFGKPSMTGDDGSVALGVDLPPADEAVEQAARAMVDFAAIPILPSDALELARAALSSVGLIEPSPQEDK